MENLKLLSWNCRGLNNSVTKRNLQGLLLKAKPHILLLQETKCETEEELGKSSIWNHGDYGWLTSPSVGKSGGLIITWDESQLLIVNSTINRNWIWARWRIGEGVQSFVIALTSTGHMNWIKKGKFGETLRI